MLQRAIRPYVLVKVMTVEGSAAAKDLKTFRRRKGAEDMDMDMRSESPSTGRSDRQGIATSSDSTDAATDDSAEIRLRRNAARVEVNRELRSRRTRDSGSGWAGSSIPRPEKRGKRGETLTNRKRPRRKVAAALGRGRRESEEADDEYVASHDGDSSDGGASERRLIGRRKDRRRKDRRV